MMCSASSWSGGRDGRRAAPEALGACTAPTPCRPLASASPPRSFTLPSPQIATSKEVKQLIAVPAPEAAAELQAAAAADGRHVEGAPGPQPLPLEGEDAYGFQLDLTPEQAAIRERCRAKQERQQAKWQQCTRAAAQGGGAAGVELVAQPDVLKKLCRKVRGSVERCSAQACNGFLAGSRRVGVRKQPALKLHHAAF